MDKVEIMWETLKLALGSDGLVEELHRSLNVDVLEEHLEYIARMNDIIELQGVVGVVRLQDVMDRKVARFSLTTECMYKTSDCNLVAELTWHNVVAWEEAAGSCELSDIVKGSKVRVVGRLRQSRYTGINGEEKIYYEVLASMVSIVKG